MRLYQRSAGRRPDPEPLRTDDRATILAGIGLWALALVVTLALHGRLAADGNGWWSWTALTGIGLGVLALGYLRRSRRG